MPFLASSFTIDSSSSTGRCNYPLIAIGGAPVATSIVAGGAPLRIIAGDPYVCTDAPYINTAPLKIPPCPTGTRTVKAEVNTSVLIDEKFPVVSGDVVNSDRPLTGPYQQPRIVIGSNQN